MKQKKFLNLFLVSALVFSMLTGCGNSSASGTTLVSDTNDVEDMTGAAGEGLKEVAGSELTTEESQPTEDDNQTLAEQLLVDLTGMYQELWPVILADEYEPVWIDNCTKLVGEENAQAAYEKLASMVTGEIYGEEAVKAYADGNGVYDCSFTQGVSTLEFEGSTSTIKGYDASGTELFSHTYHYIGMEEMRGLYEYESDDADSGEFTYFCLAPDTSATTYHIELRYGSDLNALAQYDAGNYAYWLAAGISTEYDRAMIENCIELFCTENLSE